MADHGVVRIPERRPAERDDRPRRDSRGGHQQPCPALSVARLRPHHLKVVAARGGAGQPFDRVEGGELGARALGDGLGERRLDEGLRVDRRDPVGLDEVRDLRELGGRRLDVGGEARDRDLREPVALAEVAERGVARDEVLAGARREGRAELGVERAELVGERRGVLGVGRGVGRVGLAEPLADGGRDGRVALGVEPEVRVLGRGGVLRGGRSACRRRRGPPPRAGPRGRGWRRGRRRRRAGCPPGRPRCRRPAGSPSRRRPGPPRPPPRRPAGSARRRAARRRAWSGW